jgi:hypothetical protein
VIGIVGLLLPISVLLRINITPLLPIINSKIKRSKQIQKETKTEKKKLPHCLHWQSLPQAF